MKDLWKSHLVQTGEIEKLKILLKQRLTENGWRDEMKSKCRAIVLKRGVANITIDDLVEGITKDGRERIGDKVKEELLHCVIDALKSGESKM